MATWALTTFTTPSDLTKIEEEITRFTSIGTTTYTAEALNIAATTPTTTGIDISNGQGIYEVWGIVNTTGAIKDGQSLSISIQDSDDNITYAEIHKGQRVYYRAASGSDITLTAGDVLFKWVIPSDAEDYIQAVISSNAASSGKVDIYVVSRWDAKIALAKSFMGDDLERMLINAGLDTTMDYADGDILLDIINNKSIFNNCSSYLTLSLIFEDLMTSGDENDVFKLKADRYYTRYKDKLNIAFGEKDLDINQDGTVDEYKDQSNVTRRITR